MQKASIVRLPSILDNDFYKFTMQYAVVHLFPRARAKYHFINRGQHHFPEGFAEALRAAVQSMTALYLTKDEKRFLSNACPYLSPTYLDFLEGYRYDPDEVQIEQNGNDINVSVEGFWYRSILWDVPLLSIISELFYRLNNMPGVSDERAYSIT